VTEDLRLQLVARALEESARVKHAMMDRAGDILAAADRLAGTFRDGNRLYACGNGGSACDAMHLVEELVARYKRTRPGIPAHHLIDGPTLTCWSNDFEFDTAFRRQVETLVRPGDVLVAISTSGNSRNVLLAVEAAAAAGAWTLGLTGDPGGRLADVSDVVLKAPSSETERIQEAHICIIHILCELLETSLFGSGDGVG
jgi:D-sedoheptulose 7-phosphate isomerase